nr:nucleotide-binding alpha-beta plait domain-containing protein [Tanacetum cinerariifolium]
MSSDSHATISYTSMSSYEVIVNGYYGMPMDPLDPYIQLVMRAPPLPDYIPGPEAPPSPDYIPGPEYPEYLPPADDVLLGEEQPLPAAVSATTEGDDDADDDGDNMLEDDADNEDEEESSDKEEEKEEHLAPTVPAPALYSSVSDSEETEPFEEGETTATPPPFRYRVVARMSVRPHIPMLLDSKLEIERLLAIPTPPLSLVSPTSYPLPPFLMPLPIFTPLPTSSFPLPFSLPSTSGSKSIPEADIPLRKRYHFTTPTSGYEVGESSVAAARKIRPALTIADRRRADDRLIGRLRRERRYFRTLSTIFLHLVYHLCTGEIERLLAIPTQPLSPVSPTSYPLPPLPLPIFTPLPTSSFPLPLSLLSTFGSESIPEADIPLQKRARFTTPTSGYEVGESSVAVARQIRPALTIADKRRANDRLIGRPRRERRSPFNPNFVDMGSQRSKEDDVARISTSIFVTNFPENFTAKDLFNTCNEYGYVVDSFIPLKRSKVRKRFGFVRFINVFSVERLVSNLCTLWIDRLKLHANVTRFHRSSRKPYSFAQKLGGTDKNAIDTMKLNANMSKKHAPIDKGVSFENVMKCLDNYGSKVNDSPALILEDDCVLSKDLSNCLFGRVKEFTSLANIKLSLNNEGFLNLKISYMGERWIMVEFNDPKAKNLFRENTSVNSWFSQITQASTDFVLEGRIAWVEIEGVQFKLCDVEGIPKTLFEEDETRKKSDEVDSTGKQENKLEDPFNLYPLLKKKGIDTINQEPDYNLKYLPGFTPKADTDGTSVHDEAANDVNIPSRSEANVNMGDNLEGGSEYKGSGHFKQSNGPRSSGGSILDLLDDVVKQNGMDLLIIVVYAPHGAKEKVMLWDYLAREITRWKGKVVVMGDFNEVRFHSDRFGSNFNIHGANIFNSFISTAGLTEVELGGCSFTWCHKSAKKMSKFDRFFVSENFLNTYPHIFAISLERFLSDHCLILLREHHLDYGSIPFRFFHYWCEIDGFRKLVADSWLEAPTNEACDMLNFTDQLNSKLETVENLIDSGFGNDVVVSKRMDIVKNLQHINNLKRALAVRGIMADGLWINEPRLVKHEFLMHFSNRFTKPDHSRAILQIDFPKNLTSIQQSELESKVSKEEIKRAVWDCGTDKAPGPDGFTLGFYRNFWSIIENDAYK